MKPPPALQETLSDFPPCIALTTCAQPEEAASIARTVVEEGLAACVNILPGLSSIYRWEGAVQEERECLMVIKTLTAVTEALRQRVVELHSYAVPEFVILPIVSGHPPYLQWLTENVQGKNAGFVSNS